ncbi:hypothetical protein DE146DRAFT_632769 [Phaeosphaeria sp. MPI-PUGE-AT-0046c]|nr:hypothetical protein DE146DRAFT_632769 [Phaeosphaeria sp. MPI-PUGE-AT-0046c]
MKFSNILAVFALALPTFAKDTKSKGKCTAALEGQTGCISTPEADHVQSGHSISPGWGPDKVVICRNGHWDVIVKCAPRMFCWEKPEAWCRDETNYHLPKEAWEKWNDPSWLGGKPVAGGAVGQNCTS